MTSLSPPAPSIGRTLFLITLLGLFVELLLIRWIGTEVRLFAYLQNTVLVVCFMGLGMGCLDARKPFVLREMLLPLLVLAGLLSIPYVRVVMGWNTQYLSILGGLVIWTPDAFVFQEWLMGLTALLFTLVLLICIWDVFVPIGRLLGQSLDRHPHPIRAYSIDLAGSLCGIWLFVVLSRCYAPPAVWCLVAVGLAAFLLDFSSSRWRVDAALLAGIAVFGALALWEPSSVKVIWSPYQKLVLQQGEKGELQVSVNNTRYQMMFDLRPETIAKDPQKYPAHALGYSQYDLPSKLHPQPQKLLCVGAGSGNDAAGGLRNHVSEIVAVEIDPAIIALGREYHPEHPYDSPKVRLINDDARAFFTQSKEKFDVISFGLLDSHTTTAMTNARLDHYVYTIESLRQAKQMLAPGGVMVLAFEAQRDFIADRIFNSLKEVFGHAPLVFRVPGTSTGGWGGLFFVTGDLTTVQKQLDADPKLAALLKEWEAYQPPKLTGTTLPATDDWPYLYLESPHIPLLYFLLAGLLLALFARGLFKLGHNTLFASWDMTHWHFYFLGAAFLLLEVQNVSKSALVLGNTWLVSAVVITGVLGLAITANGLVAILPRLPSLPIYILLWASCIGLYFFDLSQLNSLAYGWRIVAVGLLAGLPMLFSGIIFVRSFAAAPRKDTVLGANLFGALTGGLLESLTFLLGFKALLLIVAAFYFCAFLTRPKVGPAPPATTE